MYTRVRVCFSVLKSFVLTLASAPTTTSSCMAYLLDTICRTRCMLYKPPMMMMIIIIYRHLLYDVILRDGTIY